MFSARHFRKRLHIEASSSYFLAQVGGFVVPSASEPRWMGVWFGQGG
jgi:hypothetical protein